MPAAASRFRPGWGRAAEISASEGRELFGLDPAGYAAGRPGYPAEIFETLESRCELSPGTPTLEIGSGGGQATGELLARGAQPLVAVEPNGALADFLARRFGARVDVRRQPFEDVELPEAAFALAASATAFHWVDQQRGLEQLARVLRPGGWWAAWWTHYYDPEREDELYDSLTPILAPLSGFNPGGSTGLFSFDREARVADLDATGAFRDVAVAEVRWSLLLNPASARALFGTFSNVLALDLDEREDVLRRIERVLLDDFGGSFRRTVVTILYTAQRKPR
ncbi:MAG: class I SAM-dependent methyltransferase [Actinobacteria bacterium]|nr:class I SAM-dependent methyltransferase [Actinomycetota bacterium]